MAKKKKTGRPSKYELLEVSKKLKSIEGWARQGSLNEEIAEMLGVSPATLYVWKGKYPEFREAIRAGAPESNGEILNSAYLQAVGYYATQREIIKLKKPVFREIAGDQEDKNNNLELVKDDRGNAVYEDVAEVVEFKKYFPADGRMTQYMLNNRLRELYQQHAEQKDTDNSESGIVMMPEVTANAQCDMESTAQTDTISDAAGV